MTENKQTVYYDLWRPSMDAQTLDEMIEQLEEKTELLRQMRDDGVTLHANRGIGDDYASLHTSDPEVAKKYGMQQMQGA